MINEAMNLLNIWSDANRSEERSQQSALDLLETAEKILEIGNNDETDSFLQNYLSRTGRTEFLQELKDPKHLIRWADSTFLAIQQIQYSLLSLFEDRVKAFANRPLFQEMNGPDPAIWSYLQIQSHVREIAAVFHSSVVVEEPRIALFTDNCVEGACCDLACLFYDILDTPLNIHFSEKVLSEIFQKLNINIVVTDTLDRADMLLRIRKNLKMKIQIFIVDPKVNVKDRDIQFLGSACKSLQASKIDKILDTRRRRPLNEVATIMFTSGSTGMPKGVSFSSYHLISKRFARAAALPKVGEDEILLCYLPLFHTFGRYFEMLGAIYWCGTYVFTGNPSAETLLSQFPRVNPTGFISIPLRWVQLHERCIDKMDLIPDPKNKAVAFREIVGSGLRWGISAAGYLDPKIFRFFQRNGVALVSGFGMTEATGGITMTPPDDYVDQSTGIPLPGVYTRFTDKKELEISGHYIAHYLDKKGPGDIIPYPGEEKGEEYWLPTGDLFQVAENGHYQIVDRVKDIYKNNKGQTVAPRKVESKFIGVPGIKRAFLVGDGRPYNVLFIVPDLDDPVIQSLDTEENRYDYFLQLVRQANINLAPYERVINFMVLERDFDVEKKELTPKGSFNRKTIEDNFADQIKTLYASEHVTLSQDKFSVKIPRWFFRDLGLLENDIQLSDDGLLNLSTEKRLKIIAVDNSSTFQVGDLNYTLTSNTIDMGIFARQPRLWAGNASLINFCPIKDGWDIPLQDVTAQILRPQGEYDKITTGDIPKVTQFRDHWLETVNKLVTLALFAEIPMALNALEKMDALLKEVEDRYADLIRRRLEALAYHPAEEVRCKAYRILLMDAPTPDYSTSFPTFVNSGLPYLNKDSIEKIAFSKLERRRLEALRKRLFSYRTQLSWPISDITRQQFIQMFEILAGFVEHHPEFYRSVRSELASWILHKEDTQIAEAVEDILKKMVDDYENKLTANSKQISEEQWLSRLVFEEGMPDKIVERIKVVLIGTTFLKQSIMLAFDEPNFELEDIPEQGVWISPLQSTHHYQRYRMSVTTRAGNHYDLQLVLLGDFITTTVRESVYWLASVAGFPFAESSLPQMGCFRQNLGAWSVTYVGGLTVWEKVRQAASIHTEDRLMEEIGTWRKIFIRALSAYFRGWHHSGYRIVPGSVSPKNVSVPEQDFRGGTKIVSLAGWCHFEDMTSLIKPMVQNFYFQTIGHYPAFQEILNIEWIFDACFESFEESQAVDVLKKLQGDLKKQPLVDCFGVPLSEKLASYLDNVRSTYYIPIPLRNAVDRYRAWETMNPTATSLAMEQTLVELYRLYRIQRFPEIARYYLYRHTYFSKASYKTLEAFDLLLDKMTRDTKRPAVQLMELSELQQSLSRSADLEVFSRLVFPQKLSRQKVEVLRVGEGGGDVIVQSSITDRHGESYVLRAPVKPIEIGELYRLFFDENYPITISEQDQYFIATDANDRIIGGIVYKLTEDKVARLEGIVVSTSLKERGIGSAMLEDFANRVVSQGSHIIKTHFYHTPFFTKQGFNVDERWGALVKFLSPEMPGDDDVQQRVIEQTE